MYRYPDNAGGLRRSGRRRKARPDSFRPGDFRYIAFNKPFAVLTQFTRPAGSEKETLGAFGLPEAVYPLGRLDYDSEGLLLLSDDPRLNNFLLHPSHGHERTYLAQIEGIPDAAAIALLQGGVTIEGRKTLPAGAALLESEPNLPPRPVPIRFRRSIPTSWLQLTLREGRNRQARRMTAAIGHPTLRLVRVRIGALDLMKLALAPGEWRDLTAHELLDALQQ